MKVTPPTSANFNHFVGQLHTAIEESGWDVHSTTTVPRLLDGAAAHAAKSLLPLQYRQEHGIFFSGHEIATRAAGLAKGELAARATVFDPACGAGDLLLAAARHMPLGRTQLETILHWTRAIGGSDIHEEFVIAARMRLLLLARLRHMERRERTSAISLQPWMFAKVQCADYLENHRLGSDYSCIIANPPFGDALAPEDCSWSTGKTQLAAVFVDKILSRSNAGQHIIAILPDVLRSGTRYGRWRDQVSGYASTGNVISYGRFDEHTDVDVFLLDLHAQKTSKREASLWPCLSVKSEKGRLKDSFDVRIGPVVPHRHNGGPWVPYICVKSAPSFSEITVTKKRRFDGTLFTPPFVVIRRTSNPADEHRIIPTIVKGIEPIAVENHLIVIMPKKKGLAACRELYGELIDPAARKWLDTAIRCRHLTKSVLLEMPIRHVST